PFDVPPTDNSAVDGYAVGATDIPASGTRELTVVADLPAGAVFPGALATGQAVRIMTGAPIPTGADTVYPQEIVERSGSHVRAGHAAQAGPDLRRQSLHATRLRRAVRWQRDRPRDRARRARRPARAVARGEPDRRRGDDVRRRLGGHLRSGQGRARRDRRDRLLAGRDAAGTAACRRPDRRRALLRPARQPRGLVLEVHALRP